MEKQGDCGSLDLDNCFLVLEVSFCSNKYRSKAESRGQEKDENMCESNSAQRLSLRFQLPLSPAFLCLWLWPSSWLYDPQVALVMGLKSWENCFCLLSGQPLSHMMCGQLWLLVLAADGPLFCFKKQASSRRENGDSRQQLGHSQWHRGNGCWK